MSPIFTSPSILSESRYVSIAIHYLVELLTIKSMSKLNLVLIISTCQFFLLRFSTKIFLKIYTMYTYGYDDYYVGRSASTTPTCHRYRFLAPLRFTEKIAPLLHCSSHIMSRCGWVREGIRLQVRPRDRGRLCLNLVFSYNAFQRLCNSE